MSNPQNRKSINNPFGKLTVGGDKDLQADLNTNLSSKISPLPEDKLRKKVRPAENVHILEEGFTEVRRGKASEMKFKDVIFLPEESGVDEGKKAKTHFHPRGGKRMFERRSGTGRGKEISKAGAGGKTTWGNIDQIAKDESIDYIYQEEIHRAEDKCILY